MARRFAWSCSALERPTLAISPTRGSRVSSPSCPWWRPTLWRSPRWSSGSRRCSIHSPWVLSLIIQFNWSYSGRFFFLEVCVMDSWHAVFVYVVCRYVCDDDSPAGREGPFQTRSGFRPEFVFLLVWAQKARNEYFPRYIAYSYG